MEIKLLDGEIFELEEVKVETLHKIKSAIEWYYEQDGDLIDFNECMEQVDEEMEKEKWIYNATDVFYTECEKAYYEAVDEIEQNIKDWTYQKEEERKDRFDR